MSLPSLYTRETSFGYLVGNFFLDSIGMAGYVGKYHFRAIFLRRLFVGVRNGVLQDRDDDAGKGIFRIVGVAALLVRK